MEERDDREFIDVEGLKDRSCGCGTTDGLTLVRLGEGDPVTLCPTCCRVESERRDDIEVLG